jgi:hypothetical protein
MTTPVSRHPGLVSRGEEIPYSGERPDGQKEDHGQDLRGGISFAHPRGCNITGIEQQKEQQASDEDEHVAADHHDGEPEGNDFHDGEHHERCRHKQFVGYGIEIEPDDRPLAKPSCQYPVQHVAGPGHYEDQECEPEPV